MALLTAATIAGVLVLQRTGRANPWFMGALPVAMGLTMAGVELSAMPRSGHECGSTGDRCQPGGALFAGFLRAAPQWLSAVAAGTVGMIVLCGGFAAALAWSTGLGWATLVLGTSPGGIGEMAITAKVLHLGCRW